VKINLIIFSISSRITSIQDTVKSIENCHPVYLLSPHVAFDNEIEDIKKTISNELHFISFYEFISQDEMEYCDIHADKLILDRYKTRLGHLNSYYDKIKELKNDFILSNIKSKFCLVNKYILADDLGIDGNIWISDKFINKIVSKSKNNSYGLMAKAGKFIFTKIECNILKYDEDACYLLGKSSRVLQYLNKDKFSLKKLSFSQSVVFNLTYKLSVLKARGVPISLLFNILSKMLGSNKISKTITPIHGYEDSYGELSENLGLTCIVLQDGYLPGYYTGAYLKYWEKVNQYYIWDRLSDGYFKRHDIPYEKWPLYKDFLLSKITNKDLNVKKIVYLSSGAGDWTALKNRSDEDLIFLALLNASKIYPDIHFLFRPHPLWMHEKHQGVNSINRLIEYTETLNLSNFSISVGALEEGVSFSKYKQVSVKSLSIDKDIDSSDIIFGDHSQSMIESAKKGKIMTSINLARREGFFSSYSKLGFPILQSERDIIEFISIFNDNLKKNEFINNYNDSVELYNAKYN